MLILGRTAWNPTILVVQMGVFGNCLNQAITLKIPTHARNTQPQGPRRSSETGVVGWDPISLARPLTWIAVVLGVFLIGFFWEFLRVSSR